MSVIPPSKVKAPAAALGLISGTTPPPWPPGPPPPPPPPPPLPVPPPPPPGPKVPPPPRAWTDAATRPQSVSLACFLWQSHPVTNPMIKAAHHGPGRPRQRSTPLG